MCFELCGIVNFVYFLSRHYLTFILWNCASTMCFCDDFGFAVSLDVLFCRLVGLSYEEGLSTFMVGNAPCLLFILSIILLSITFFLNLSYFSYPKKLQSPQMYGLSKTPNLNLSSLGTFSFFQVCSQILSSIFSTVFFLFFSYCHGYGYYWAGVFLSGGLKGGSFF